MDSSVDIKIRRPTAIKSDDFTLLESSLESAKIVAVDVYWKGIDKGCEYDHLQIATRVASVSHVFLLDFSFLRLKKVSQLIANTLKDSKVLKIGLRFSRDFTSFCLAMRSDESTYHFEAVKPFFRTSILPKYFDASHVEEKLLEIRIPLHELQHISSSFTPETNGDKIIAVANFHFLLEMFANNFPPCFGDETVNFAYFAHPQKLSYTDTDVVYLGTYQYQLNDILAIFVEEWCENISAPGSKILKRKLENTASCLLFPSHYESVKFIADDMLLGLAKGLKQIGVDVEIFPRRNHSRKKGERKNYEKELISYAHSGNKIILTCCKLLWKRDQMQVERESKQSLKKTPRVFLLKSEDKKSQFLKVVEHFRLDQKKATSS